MPLTLLLGASAALCLPRAVYLTMLAARHEPQIPAWSTGEDLETRRGQFLGQPSLPELLRAVAIDGRTEERVGDPTMRRRRGPRPLATQQIASPGDEGVQLGALALQRFTGRPRIAELERVRQRRYNGGQVRRSGPPTSSRTRTPSASRGSLTVACPCGVTFERWITPHETSRWAG
jgi:hypothetical protein